MTDGVGTMWDMQRASEEVVKVLVFKTRAWEQTRWNRWDPVTRVEGTDEAWTDMCSLSAVVFDLAFCHALRNLGKQPGVPDEWVF